MKEIAIHTETRFKRLGIVQSGLVSIAAGMFFTLIVPLQTFLANRDLFEFSAWSVIGEAAPVFLIVSTILFALLLTSGLVAGRILHVIAIAVLVCGYLEVGVLSIGLPPLDGEMRAFANPFRSLIDTIILGIAFLAIVLLFKWIKGVVHYVALGVIVMSIASLFDAGKPENSVSASDLSDGFCPQLDVVQSLRFSPTRNIIMLVLDSTPASIASTVVRDSPELQKCFPGFVAYEKNMAMHEVTIRGLPGLMTGRFLEPEMPTSEYASTMFGENSLLMPYVKAGDPVYFSDQMLNYGYTNRRLGDFSNIGTSLVNDGPVFFRNSSSIPYISLFDVVRFRLVPYKFKLLVLKKAYGVAMKGTVKVNYGSEDFLYPLVASHPIGTEPKTTLSILHTSGVHGPITRDRLGNKLQEPTQEVAAYYEYCVYLMNKVAEFLGTLRSRGVYDNSTIILVADHGLEVLREGGVTADGSTGHGAESSILWVKPAGATGNMEFSSLATSNCRVADLVKRLATEDLKREDLDSVLFAKERRFWFFFFFFFAF